MVRGPCQGEDLPGMVNQVCVCFSHKQSFLPVDIQHTRCPCWFFIPGDTSCVVTNYDTEKIVYIVMQ